ncbi:GNAT family N-acetyltransferase [Phenylobacterium sp.]|uniref:GNAT family N-acetyltransferase n=1 Tax=Phenylobacterium sp. TaxID=1871053 RepID=UPI0025DD7A97|nr:GNAT family N-acetyltransferase [Phenylobacterium sp.]
MGLRIESARLCLDRFELADADDVFRCITPAVTRFLSWDPPTFDDYMSRCESLVQADIQTEVQFVIRRKDSRECLGIAGIDRLRDDLPELGIWMKEAAHGQGYGREAVEAIAAWASSILNKGGFIYPVAIENIASRRIAEGLRGEVFASRSSQKYDSVVYRIPAVT